MTLKLQKVLFKFQWVLLFVCLIFGHIVKHDRLVKINCLPVNSQYTCIIALI